MSYHLVERPGMEYGQRLAKRVSGGRRRANAPAPPSTEPHVMKLSFLATPSRTDPPRPPYVARSWSLQTVG